MKAVLQKYTLTNAICKSCGVRLSSEDNWYPSCSRKNEHICKACRSVRDRLRYQKNASRHREFMKDYRVKHRARIAELNRAYYRANSDWLRGKTAEYYRRNADNINMRRRQASHERKVECITRLGSKCVYCGETTMAFLTVGHVVDGDGAKHRKELSLLGSSFYEYLLKNDMRSPYPIQVECFNCNESKKRVSKTRRAVVAAYGGKCVCCGENKVERLTIGHPDHDGAKHRKSLSPGKQANLYRRLKELGYPTKPDGFRVEIQCWNCNMGSEVAAGTCPHRILRMISK